MERCDRATQGDGRAIMTVNGVGKRLRRLSRRLRPGARYHFADRLPADKLSEPYHGLTECSFTKTILPVQPDFQSRRAGDNS